MKTEKLISSYKPELHLPKYNRRRKKRYKYEYLGLYDKFFKIGLRRIVKPSWDDLLSCTLKNYREALIRNLMVPSTLIMLLGKK